MKKAIRRLIRGADGRMRTVFIDLETLQPITDLSGYEIVNSASNQVENVQDVDNDEEVVEPAAVEGPVGPMGGGGGTGADYVNQIRADKAMAQRDRFPPAPTNVNTFPPAPAQPKTTPDAGKPVGATSGRRSTLPGTTPNVQAAPERARPGSIEFSDMRLDGPPADVQAPRQEYSSMTPETVPTYSPEITTEYATPVPTTETISEEPPSRGLQDVADVTKGGDLSFYNPGQSGVQPETREGLIGASREMDRNLGITSGYRSPEHNRRVGGSPGSRHVQGRAADIDLKGLSGQERQQLVQELTQRGAGGFSTYSRSPDMLHVDWGARPAGERGRINRTADPLEAPHFMHDRSDKNMGNAPGWYQQSAASGGIIQPSEMNITPSGRPDQMMAEPTLDEERMAQRGMTTAQQVIADATRPTSEYFGYSAYDTPAGTNPGNLTAAEMAAMGYGWNDMTDDQIADLALVAAGELSPSARASIASGNPTAEAVEAFGGIMGTMSNRAASRGTTPVEEAYRPQQFSAANPGIIGASRQMYTPVATGMNQAVSDFYSGQMANTYGVGGLIANPGADHYYNPSVAAPAWGPQMSNVTYDTTGHAFGSLPNYSSTPTAEQYSQFGIDQRGRTAASQFSDPTSGFSGPSRFGSQYVDSPAHGMSGARGGFTSDYSGGSDYGSASYDSTDSWSQGYTGGGYDDSSGYGGASYDSGNYGGGGYSGDYSSGGSGQGYSGGYSGGGWNDASDYSHPGTDNSYGSSSGSSGSYSGGAAKDAGEHASGSGGYGSGSWV